jgi:hypothetical protein
VGQPGHGGEVLLQQQAAAQQQAAQAVRLQAEKKTPAQTSSTGGEAAGHGGVLLQQQAAAQQQAAQAVSQPRHGWKVHLDNKQHRR